MNTKSFRREVLIGVGGFLVGVVFVSVFLIKPASSRLVASAALKEVVATKRFDVTSAAELGMTPPIVSPTDIRDVSFEEEFGLLRVQRPIRAGVLSAIKSSFDLPRQNPWVAPYEFLIHPDQRH